MNFSFAKIKRTNLIFVVLILAASILASLPFLRGDFFHFSDEPHIANLYQMVRAIEAGQIPPRWAPDMSFEYGYPLFNFYYVLPYYLGSLIYFLSHSLIFSLKFVFFMTIPASGILMYLWLKKHTDSWAALLGSILYIFTPYRAVDLYVRGAIGEAMAFAFFPLLLLAIFRIYEKGRLKDVGILAFVTGLFLLSHNLAPILFLPFAALYALVLAKTFGSLKSLLRTILGFILGLGTASYFVVPAFIEKGLLVGTTPFNYLDHFPFIKQLIYSPFRYGASLPGPNDDISLQVGIINWILVILSVFLLRRTLKKGKLLYALFLGTILLSLFLMNIRSIFLWEAFSLSSYIQFPWRILMLTTFLTSSLVIFVGSGKYRKALLAVLAAASILVNFSYFRPSEYFKADDNYFLNRFFARRTSEGQAQAPSKDYLNYSEDYLLLPKLVEARPQVLPEAKFTSETAKIEKIAQNSSVDYSAKLTGEGMLSFNSYYFPGWYASIDGKEAEIKPLKPLGNIGVEVKKGEGEVRLFWKETPLRAAMDILSLVSLTSALALSLFGGKIRRLL